MEANEEAQAGNGTGGAQGGGWGWGRGWRPVDEHRVGTGRKVGTETRAGYVKEDQDMNGDGNEDRIGEGGGEVKKLNKPHKNCRRDQALLFRTRHHLCRQGLALVGTR